MRRRRYLGTLGLAVLAGCSGTGGGNDRSTDGGSTDAAAGDGDASTTATDRATTATDGGSTTDSGGTETSDRTEQSETTSEPDSAMTERWRVAVPGNHLARTGETLVAGGGDRVTALNADGSVAWETSLDAEVDDLGATAGTAVAAKEGGGVVAFDATSGDRRWAFTLVEDERAPYGLATAGEWVARTAGRDGSEYRVVAAGSGETATSGTFDATGYAVAGREDGTVVFGTAETTTAVDAGSGETLWTSDATPTRDAMAVGDDLVVVGRGNGAVALAAADGTERWRYEDGYDFAPKRASIGDSRVFLGAGSADRLTAVAAGDGTETWTYEIVGRETLPPVTVGGAVVATPYADTLALLDPESGDVVYEQGDFRAPSGVSATGSRLAVGSDERVRSFQVNR